MKKKYEKPQIIHTEPIEGIAGACGGAGTAKAADPCTVIVS